MDNKNVVDFPHRQYLRDNTLTYSFENNKCNIGMSDHETYRTKIIAVLTHGYDVPI